LPNRPDAVLTNGLPDEGVIRNAKLAGSVPGKDFQFQNIFNNLNYLRFVCEPSFAKLTRRFPEGFSGKPAGQSACKRGA
jgi:hypothetical protein